LVTIGSGVSEGAGVEFPTFPLTCVVVLKTLWHYRASVWLFLVSQHSWRARFARMESLSSQVSMEDVEA